MSQDRVLLRLAGPDAEADLRLVARATELGFRRFLASRPVEPMPNGTIAYREDAEGVVEEGSAHRWDRRTIRSPADLDRVRASLRSGDRLILRFPEERVLPLESLLASELSPGEWMVDVDELAHLSTALGALERGASRCVVPVRSDADLRGIARALELPYGGAIEWVPVRVSRVTPAGLGDRVIVDTTSLLRPEEGLLVGSAARLLIHVASEAEGSRYTRPRPFRINAGAAHSYAMLLDGSTRYLSELEAGDSVLVAPPRGPVRGARVGRLKIERRPLALVEVVDAGRPATLFAQEAETVRLSTEGGRVAITELRPGTEVFAARAPHARHLGTPIDESIEER